MFKCERCYALKLKAVRHGERNIGSVNHQASKDFVHIDAEIETLLRVVQRLMFLEDHLFEECLDTLPEKERFEINAKIDGCVCRAKTDSVGVQ